MKKIILTGANGLVGGFFQKNYSDKYNFKTFSFLNDDFDKLDISGHDVIVHCGALTHQINELKWEEYVEVNISQTTKLANKAKKNGVKHFIFLSTIKVYGEVSKAPFTEKSKPNPLDFYSKSKLKAENELLKLSDKNFAVSIIRSPLIYGQNAKANLLRLINLIKICPILPFRDVNNRRSMVFIGNLCNIIDLVICKEKFGIFLASDDISLSINELILILAKGMDRKVFLIKSRLFNFLLKNFMPHYYQRFFLNLEIDNRSTLRSLQLKENKYKTHEAMEGLFRDKE